MTDTLKEIGRRFTLAFVAGDFAVLDEVAAEGIVDHDAPPGAEPGRVGLHDAVAMFQQAFPDLETTIEHVFAEGDTVAVHGRAVGTHNGPLLGAPPTGRRAGFSYVDIFRVEGGKVVEAWHVEDMAGLLAQLGLLPV
ncbi:MAG TPA: ester cyclase [Acidimicrobiales bacterium]|nr:ester cyclase [Acidimicrobiales bacterium]